MYMLYISNSFKMHHFCDNGTPLNFAFTPKLIWTKTKELTAMQAQKAVCSIFKFKRNLVIVAQMMHLNFLIPW